MPPAIGLASDPAPESLGFGTAHPSIVEAVDPAGRWIVVCQARADTDGDGRIITRFDEHHGAPFGDEVVPYLVIGGGEGTAIDRLLAVDPRSRFVVGRPKGRVTLYDTRTGTATDLAHASAPTEDGEPASVEPWVSFDDAGRFMLIALVRGTGKDAVTRIVVRELATGVETLLDPGLGVLHRAALSGGGALIVAAVVVEDTDGNGELEAPRRRTTFYTGGCGGTPAAGTEFRSAGDRPTHRVLSTDGSVRRDAPGFIQFVGSRWVRRLGDASLVIEGPSGDPVTIAPAAAKAKVLSINDATATLLWASAANDDEEARVFAAGPAGVREIGTLVAVTKWHDEARNRPSRVDPILDREGPAFDWLKGAVVIPRGKFMASERARVLVQRDENLIVMDVDAGTETILASTTRRGYGVWRAGRYAAVCGLVIDMASTAVIGTYELPAHFGLLGPNWAVRDDGALLRSRPSSVLTGQHSGISLPLGPFRWEAPVPPK